MVRKLSILLLALPFAAVPVRAQDPASTGAVRPGPLEPSASVRFSEFLDRGIDDPRLRQELERNRRQGPTKITSVAVGPGGRVAVVCQRPLPAALAPEERQQLVHREALAVLSEWELLHDESPTRDWIHSSSNGKEAWLPALSDKLATAFEQANRNGDLQLFLWKYEETDDRIQICVQSNQSAIAALLDRLLQNPQILQTLYDKAVEAARAGRIDQAFIILRNDALRLTERPVKGCPFFLALYRCYLVAGLERKEDVAKVGARLRDNHAAELTPELRQLLAAEAEAAGLAEEAAAWRTTPEKRDLQ